MPQVNIPTPRPTGSFEPTLAANVESALNRSQQFLASAQRDDGHWCGELEGDTILESEYILTMFYLGRESDETVAKAARQIRQQQIEGGGWAIYPGGPAEISASVKAYFVLKLLGDDPEAPHMQAAAAVIRKLGGIEATNSFTKIFLAIFGQYDWDQCPAVLPEIMLLPKWFYFNIYEMSSWSRAIFVPLSIIWAHRPRREVPPGRGIAELRIPGTTWKPVNAPTTRTGRSWARCFVLIDRLLKILERIPVKPFRRRGLRQAEQWILHRLQKSDGLGAIFPPIVNTIIAFDCLGYRATDPVLAGQIAELKKLEIEEEDILRVQPCFSPVWDTCLILNSMLESGLPPNHPRVQQAARWLLDKEVTEEGDWAVMNPDAPVGGWYFEYANEYYPDCDDTAEVLTGLARVRFDDPEEEERKTAAVQRGLDWLLAMQNRDGGWAAFDCGCDKEPLTYIPFADHNAMIDPSNSDITGRVLKALDYLRVPGADEAVRRAVEFLKRWQEPDGTWYGRWGCNHLYGTWLALWGLKHGGEDLACDRYARVLGWLRGCQNPDGGWGESQGSYEDPSLKGMGKSTASQTAWALMVFFAFEVYDCPEVERGLRYLLRTQRDDGSWQDEYWTATGFPKVFYLNYHLYATCFSLLAVSVYHHRGRTQVTTAPQEQSAWITSPEQTERRPEPDVVGAELLRARRA